MRVIIAEKDGKNDLSSWLREKKKKKKLIIAFLTGENLENLNLKLAISFILGNMQKELLIVQKVLNIVSCLMLCESKKWCFLNIRISVYLIKCI